MWKTARAQKGEGDLARERFSQESAHVFDFRLGTVQGPAEVPFPGYVNYCCALIYNICLNLLANILTVPGNGNL